LLLQVVCALASARLTSDRSAKKDLNTPFMDYERLARTLLRLLAIWLIVQSLAGLIAGTMLAVQFADASKSTGSTMWSYPVASGVSIVFGVALFLCSGRLAKVVAA
jgi:hypothetical protein